MERKRNVIVTTAVAVLVAAAGTLGGTLTASADDQSGSAANPALGAPGDVSSPQAQGTFHRGRHCHGDHGGRGGAAPKTDSGSSSSSDFAY